jgi:hypothetical protein
MRSTCASGAGGGHGGLVLIAFSKEIAQEKRNMLDQLKLVGWVCLGIVKRWSAL